MTAPICVVPALVWPSIGLSSALERAHLPGLVALLAQAVVREAPAQGLEQWLAEQFGIRGAAPLALMRLAGEEHFLGEAPTITTTDHWLCADPVALVFQRDNLLLMDPASLGVTEDEARAIIDDLNCEFAAIGTFSAASSTRWYLRLASEPGDVMLPPLADAVGRPVALFQPEGADASRWARLANELQVFCHNHAINAARESAGRPALNALWLWGNGRLPPQTLTPLAATIAGSHTMLCGLARLAGHTLQAPTISTAWQLIDDLVEPALRRDPDAWIAALEKIDHEVFAPAAKAIADGHIDGLRLISPCEHALINIDVIRRPRWKFWQRNLSGEALAQRLTRRSDKRGASDDADPIQDDVRQRDGA